MKRFRAPLLVGFVGIVGVAAMALLFGSVQRVEVAPGEGYRVHADFEDASGLVKYSRVTISGIPVGTIESIKLVTLPNGKSMARVTIRLAEDIALYEGEPTPGGGHVNGAVVTRRTATLLGDYYLDIAPGVGGRRLEDGDAIPNVVQDSGIMAVTSRIEEVADLVPTLKKIAENVEMTTNSIAGIYGGEVGMARLDALAKNVEETAADISAVTRRIREFVGSELDEGHGRIPGILANLDRLSADAALFTGRSAESLARTVKNVEEITGELKGILKKGSQGGGRGEVQESLASLRRSLTNLEGATASLANVMKKIDEGEGSLGKLVNDPGIADKTEEVVTEVGDLVKSVSRLETQLGFRSEFNIYQRAFKNYLTLRLQPSHEKYYQFDVVFDPRGSTSTLERVTLSNDPRVPPVLSERVTETSGALKFSLQFARRWGFLTGRFGLIESTGGLGADLEFLKDSLRFSFDFFDFTSDRYPRLKLIWSFAFLDYFYVTAGADDVMNKAGRDYFVGAGFRFTDNDLKALLITAPTPSM